MANKEKLLQLEHLGKRLEKNKKVKDWRRYNPDMMKEISKYTAKVREEKAREEANKREAMVDEFADRALWTTGHKKTYAVN